MFKLKAKHNGRGSDNVTAYDTIRSSVHCDIGGGKGVERGLAKRALTKTGSLGLISTLCKSRQHFCDAYRQLLKPLINLYFFFLFFFRFFVSHIYWHHNTKTTSVMKGGRECWSKLC